MNSKLMKKNLPGSCDRWNENNQNQLAAIRNDYFLLIIVVILYRRNMFSNVAPVLNKTTLYYNSIVGIVYDLMFCSKDKVFFHQTKKYF